MKKFSLLMIFSLILFSCTKEDITTPEETAKDSFKISYKGNLHPVEVDKDGNWDKSNLDTDISEALRNGHTLEIQKENTVYLFDRKDEVDTMISRLYSSTTDSKAGKSTGTATCTSYKHKNFGGISISGTNNFSYPNLKWQGFNDIISSAIITNYTSRAYLVQFFKHDNYGGSSHSVIIDPVVQSVATISNFRTIGLNDEVTSIKGIQL